MSDEKVLSPRATRFLLMGVGAALILGTITWSLTGPDPQPDPAAEPAPAATPTAAPPDPDQVLAWLPHTPAELADAGALAVRYAETARTIDYAADTDGSAQAAALAELSTADHAQALEAGSSAAAARRQLAEDQTVTTATAEVRRIERWTDTTVTLALDVRTTTTDVTGTTTDADETLLTLTDPGAWRVAAVGDPGVGQAGDTSAADRPGDED